MTDQVFIPKSLLPLPEVFVEKLKNDRSIHLVIRDSEGNTVFDSNAAKEPEREPVEIPGIIDAIGKVYSMAYQIHGEFCVSSDKCRCDEEATATLKGLGVTDEQIEEYEKRWRDE